MFGRSRGPVPRDGAVRRRLLKANDELDQRLKHDSPMREQLDKVFPDHWSFMLGEIALYSFVVLVVTGTYLTFFFKPSDATVFYGGTYSPVHHLSMSDAYASTLRISFDVRGGLLVRQIHHWAADLFVAAIAVHMARIYFTGAFRKPRELNWTIGLSLLTIAIIEGFCGYSMLDDLLSGTGVRIAASIVLSIPVIGTWLQFMIFGGQYPGVDILHRFYIAHVLLLPGLIILLIAAHLAIVVRQKHTDFPSTPSTETKVAGSRLFPVYAAKSVGLFMIVTGVLCGLGGLVQINPIWLWGPYDPSQVSDFNQPDWYMIWSEGALRLFPPWEIRAAGHDVPPLFWPAVVLPVGMLVLGLLYPMIERRLSGDYRRHNILDRPRNVPVRTAFGCSVIAFWVVLMLGGSDDVISWFSQIPYEWIVYSLRTAALVVPPVTFFVTYRICIALQQRDSRRAHTGRETGLAIRLADGGYAEITELEDAPAPAEAPTAVVVPKS